jgi:hypothetical protein
MNSKILSIFVLFLVLLTYSLSLKSIRIIRGSSTSGTNVIRLNNNDDDCHDNTSTVRIIRANNFVNSYPRVIRATSLNNYYDNYDDYNYGDYNYGYDYPVGYARHYPRVNRYYNNYDDGKVGQEGGKVGQYDGKVGQDDYTGQDDGKYADQVGQVGQEKGKDDSY